MKNSIYAAFILIISCAIFTGCTTGSHKVTGTLRPAVSPDAVVVYSKMPDHASVIGSVSADSFGGVDLQQATNDAVTKLRAQAGQMGANGLVISGVQAGQPLSGAKITGQAIYVSP